MPPTTSKEEEVKAATATNVRNTIIGNSNDEDKRGSRDSADDSVSTNSDCDRAQGEEWLFGVNFSTITSQDAEGEENGTCTGSPTSQVDQDSSNNGIHHVVADGAAADSQHESKLSLHIQNLTNMTDEPFHPSHNNNYRDTFFGDSECNGADGETDDCTRQLKQLWNLAAKLGARLESISVTTDKHGGKCLVSLIDIPKGDIVAILPRRLRIGQTTSTKQLGLPSKTPDLTALSLLLLDLMYKLRTDPRPLSSSASLSSSSSSVSITDEDKLLYCYASCLPHKCHNGLFMTPREQEYWSQFGPDDNHSAIGRFQDQGKACVNYILQHFVYNKSPNDEEEEFQPTPTIPYTVPWLQGDDDDDDDDNSDIKLIWWAISMVQSRTHGFGQLKSRWMTPIFDFCNHSPHPNCQLQGDANGDIILRSLEAIPKGCEVTIDYQVTDDAKLVACYGFSLLHPPPPAHDA